jgi:hypothetical protein
MSTVLKIMNIPVQRSTQCLHATPVFPTAGVAMTHGDDPYDRMGVVTPEAGFATPKPLDYLVTVAKYNQLFPAGQSGPACKKQIGVQVANVAIEYGSDYLLNDYCHDLAGNKTHANGQVYQDLSDYYTLSQLESMQLWQILQFKQLATNWCATHP